MNSLKDRSKGLKGPRVSEALMEKMFEVGRQFRGGITGDIEEEYKSTYIAFKDKKNKLVFVMTVYPPGFYEYNKMLGLFRGWSREGYRVFPYYWKNVQKYPERAVWDYNQAIPPCVSP